MTPLTDQQRQEIEKEIFAGRKISAIKLYRNAMESELVDAKRAVEDMEMDLRRRRPENFISTEKKGCLGVIACVALMVGLATLITFCISRS
jgi:hypothetical protein